MPFNRDKKLLFIHIPKTGGTSIEHFFEINKNENFCFYRWDRDQYEFTAKYKPFTKSGKINYEPQHYPVEVLKDLLNDYDSFFKFTFVRNPYTKLISEYYWSGNKKLSDISEFDPVDFHEWCKVFLKLPDQSHKEPQVNYADETVDFIGRYENFRDDFISLLKILSTGNDDYKVFENKQIPHEFSTGTEKSVLLPLLTNETKELIFDAYNQDFMRFDYDPLLF